MQTTLKKKLISAKYGIYFSSKTETLELKDKQKIYKLAFKETPEELDSTIEEEFYTYLKELGFHNPEWYILLYRIPHSKQVVAADKGCITAIVIRIGDKFGIISIHQ